MNAAFVFRIWSCLFVVSMLAACSEDSGELQPTIPSLSVSVSPEGPYYFPDVIKFTCLIRTDPNVGIQVFKIHREGMELFSQNNFTSPGVDFEFTYRTTQEDVQIGVVKFRFELIDKSNRQVEQITTIEVMIEYPFMIEELRPDPSWDLVENHSLNETTGDNVDIFLHQETTVTNILTAFVSRNDTRFYDITDLTLNYFNLEITTEDILSAIQTVDEVDSVIISRNFENHLPIIAKLRGKDDFAIIDFSAQSGSSWGYRKTSEKSGE